MPLAEREIRSHLLDESEEFRDLMALHREYDLRLEELSSKNPPSERDRLELVELKKRKLWLKDRMAMMIANYAHGHEQAAAS